MAWADAKTYCANLTLGGSSEWRLPTRIELESIVDYSKFNPALNTTAFPSTPSEFFWSSSPGADRTSNAWVVHFNDGSSGSYDTPFTNRVRCVR
jgi:hypothetical protein